MADVELTNVAASQVLPKGSVLRITFAERYSIQIDSSFAGSYRDEVYANIAGTKLLYPITADGAIDGESTATTDCRVSTDTALSNILAALDALSPWFVRVARVQLLTTTEAQAAATTDGAQQRQDATNTQQQTQDASNPLSQLADGLGVALSTVKWVAIVALVGAIVWFAPGLVTAAKAGVKRASKH